MQSVTFVKLGQPLMVKFSSALTTHEKTPRVLIAIGIRNVCARRLRH